MAEEERAWLGMTGLDCAIRVFSDAQTICVTKETVSELAFAIAIIKIAEYAFYAVAVAAFCRMVDTALTHIKKGARHV